MKKKKQFFHAAMVHYKKVKKLIMGESDAYCNGKTYCRGGFKSDEGLTIDRE